MSDRPENLVQYRLDLIQRQNNRVIELLDRLTDDTRALRRRRRITAPFKARAATPGHGPRRRTMTGLF